MSTRQEKKNIQIKLKWSKGDFDATIVFDESLKSPEPYLATEFGALFSGDCLEILPKLRKESIDTIFADPPFNLGKKYGDKTVDLRPDADYLQWCKKWIFECAKVLKPGGSFFLYNLPKWNILLGAYLTELNLQFRHWIAVEIKSCLPIPGRLYPSHYSLLYFSKGKPKVFRKIRTPIEHCRHCGKEIRDYGGHRDAMNPNGVNLKDVWTDIPPVRHWKFKSQERKANALSTKLLDRVVEMSTLPGQIVLDPFGGRALAFVVCEKKNRNWVGIELDFATVIAERLLGDGLHHHRNDDFVEG